MQFAVSIKHLVYDWNLRAPSIKKPRHYLLVKKIWQEEMTFYVSLRRCIKRHNSASQHLKISILSHKMWQHFCMDYRELSHIVGKKTWSIVTVSDTLVSAHSTIFFTLDIRTWVLTSVQEMTALSAGQDLYRRNARVLTCAHLLLSKFFWWCGMMQLDVCCRMSHLLKRSCKPYK